MLNLMMEAASRGLLARGGGGYGRTGGNGRFVPSGTGAATGLDAYITAIGSALVVLLMIVFAVWGVVQLVREFDPQGSATTGTEPEN